MAVIFCLAAGAVLLERLGVIVTTGLLLGFLLLVIERRAIVNTALVVAGTLLAVRLIFFEALALGLPTGVFGI